MRKAVVVLIYMSSIKLDIAKTRKHVTFTTPLSYIDVMIDPSLHDPQSGVSYE